MFGVLTNFIGGAVIISPYWALTAAHCMNSIRGHDMKTRSACIRSGSSKWEQNYVEHYIIKAIVHKKYHEKRIDYDIDILKVENAFDTNYEKPIPFAEQNYELTLVKVKNKKTLERNRLILKYIAGSEVTVIGWGLTDPDSITPSDKLRYARINIIEDVKCRNLFKDLEHNRTITSRMVCAGTPEKHSCVLDSGDPLIQRGTLIGLVSWGPLPCVHSKRPGVYTRISYFNGWIRRHMNR